MSRTALIQLTTACLLTALPAWAQNATSQQQKGAGDESIRSDLTNDLKKSGFTDVSVVPDSFLVRAKDRKGNPVEMFVTPHSVTELTAVGTKGEQQKTGGGSDKFATVPSQDELTSKAVGANVYDKANQDVGAIKDVAIENNKVKAYIVGMGGMLGASQRYVAVKPSALKLTWDANDKKWRGEMDATRQELQSAPEFKYPS